ncbi:MAG: AsmA family protein [Gammaproteobacteria bacterium]
MKSIFGIVIKIVLTLLVLGGIVLGALSYFANPERLKPHVIDYINTKYQRTLSVGDIHWRIFPKLGLSLDDVSLSDNALFGKTTFAAMKTVSVFVDTMSLLRGHVDVKTVELVDLKANLKTNMQGVNSWDDLAAAPAKAPAKTATAETATKETGSKGLAISDFSFNVEKIEITNGEMNYKNDKEGANYKVSNIMFTGENVALDKAFPVTLKFALSSSAPDVAANVSAKASLKVVLKEGAYDPNGVTLDGNVDIASLRMQGLKMASLKAPMKVNTGVITLNPISAAFYGGNLGGDATIDTSTIPSRIAANYDLKGVQIGPMLKDMGGKESFTGTLNMKGNLAFKSSAVKAQMMQSLGGKAKVNVQNGVLNGVDLGYFYAMGSNLLNPKKPVPVPANTGKTNFATTTANVSIVNGILQNNDLVILSNNIYGAGAGTVNFISDRINYRFRIQGRNGDQPVGQVIPLEIMGSTSNPSISLDMSIVKERIIEEVKSNVGQQIFKALGR